MRQHPRLKNLILVLLEEKQKKKEIGNQDK